MSSETANQRETENEQWAREHGFDLTPRRRFCSGCDHGVVAGKVCEICGGTGYEERRKVKR